MNGNEKKIGSRAQSAMEYLMTYGWAILIIAVVLAALFSLNVFNAGAQLGSACIGQPGYSCSNPAISQAGILTFQLGLGTGSTVTNVVFSCVATGNSLSASSLPYNEIQASGAALPAITGPIYSTAISNSLVSGTQITISGIQCYSPSSGAYTAAGATTLSPIGSSFTGAIWMGYAPAGTATLQFAKIATVALKSSS